MIFRHLALGTHALPNRLIYLRTVTFIFSFSLLLLSTYHRGTIDPAARGYFFPPTTHTSAPSGLIIITVIIINQPPPSAWAYTRQNNTACSLPLDEKKNI